ncbi:MAG TPA: hypothetical protein VGQ36_06760 [Thermoanaerobaculia bacterium]|jgi:hypothetical protein|nr:hypothetical protein [Thermoanaerobaculia bacterium]
MRNKLLALTLLVVAATAMAGSRDRFSYVYQRGNQSIIRGSGTIENYKRIAKRWSGEYVWIHRNGREYLIRDAGVLAAVRGAFAHMEALEPKMREVEARLRPVEKRFEEIEERMDELSDRNEEDPALERAMRAVEVEYEKAERAVELVEQEMERREEIAEKKFEEIVIRAIDQGKAQRVD